MSFVSTGNKTVGSDGPAITTPPIVGENNGVSSGAAVASVTDAAEQMAEQAVELLFGELPEPSGLVFWMRFWRNTPTRWKSGWWKATRYVPGRCSTVKLILIFFSD